MSGTSATSDRSVGQGRGRLLALCACVVVVLSGLVRWMASHDHFWLDEIWCWQLAQGRSLPQILFQIRVDNNHILNTWILSLFPPDADTTLLRSPAVLAGIGTIVLAGLSGWKRSPAHGMTALVVTGSSFVLIQYSSEARGYAYVLFFTVLCIWLMERVAARPRVAEGLLFSMSAALGFLSHFEFLTAYAGFVVWSLIWIGRRYRTRMAVIGSLAMLHVVPMITIATIGLVWYIGGMSVGGGDRQSILHVIVQAGSLAAGGPESGWLAIVVCSIALAASGFAICRLIRHGDGTGWFWGATTVSLALVLSVKHDYVYPRHFLLEILGVLLLLSYLLSELWQAGRVGRTITLVALTGMLVGNGLAVSNLLKYGRGGYPEAISYMLETSPGPVVTVGGDVDFRNETVLTYYLSRRSDAGQLKYIKRDQWTQRGVDWYLLHSFEQPPSPRPEIVDRAGNRYQMTKVFPYSGLSGWNWILYRREK